MLDKSDLVVKQIDKIKDLQARATAELTIQEILYPHILETLYLTIQEASYPHHAGNSISSLSRKLYALTIHEALYPHHPGNSIPSTSRKPCTPTIQETDT